jgi:drug/metabolite transporter (DMT)-like permease
MWASSFLLAKLAVAPFPPASLAAFRSGISALVLLAVFATVGRSLWPRAGEVGSALILGATSG